MPEFQIRNLVNLASDTRRASFDLVTPTVNLYGCCLIRNRKGEWFVAPPRAKRMGEWIRIASINVRLAQAVVDEVLAQIGEAP